MAALAETLDILSALRARYASMTGSAAMGDPKDIISALVRILDGGSVHYAMIGGMAAQVWRSEPRTTLDIDLAVRSYDDLPVSELERACVDPAWRRSKRLQDLADAASVVEAHPEVRDALSEEELHTLDR